MLRYAFRLHRWGMLGYGLVCLASAYVQGAAYLQVAGTTPESRRAFALAMSALGTQLSYLLPVPFQLDTPGGYVQWRAFGPFGLVVMVWAIASAAGAVRGDEEKQLVDTWLAAGVSRVRLVASRLAAFTLAALVVGAAGGAGALLGTVQYTQVGVGRAAGSALALWVLAVTLFTLCYLVAQLVSSVRGAQMAGAAVVVVLYLFDVVARTNHSLDGLSWVSPFKWYDATNSLAPAGHVDVTGIALSLGLIAVGGVLAGLAFARRDVRGPLFARPVREERVRDVAPSPLLAWPVARQLYRQRGVLIAWAVITAALAVFMVAVGRSAADTLFKLPGLSAFFTHGVGGDPYRAFVAVFWFSIAELLLASFAVHLVATWGADDNDGVLTATLSMPVHRWSIIAERAATAVLGVAVMVAVGSLCAGLAAAAFGIALDAEAVFRASWLLVPFGLTFAAVGAVGSARWPRAVVGVLGMLAFVSFLVWELAPLMSWPTWVANLSVFQLYGTPLITGVYWNGLWALVAITVAGFALATLLMQRREVAA